MTIKQKIINFTKRYAQAAYNVADKYGLPFDGMITQACLESTYGADAYGYNFFGIKADSSWRGDRQLLWTSEWSKSLGKYVRQQSWFRKYPSAEAGFEDYGKFITGNRRYRTAVSQYAVDKSTANYLANVARAGYATDPRYTSKLLNVLESVTEALADMPLKKKSQSQD